MPADGVTETLSDSNRGEQSALASNNGGPVTDVPADSTMATASSGGQTGKTGHNRARFCAVSPVAECVEEDSGNSRSGDPLP